MYVPEINAIRITAGFKDAGFFYLLMRLRRHCRLQAANITAIIVLKVNVHKQNLNGCLTVNDSGKEIMPCLLRKNC